LVVASLVGLSGLFLVVRRDLAALTRNGASTEEQTGGLFDRTMRPEVLEQLELAESHLDEEEFAAAAGALVAAQRRAELAVSASDVGGPLLAFTADEERRYQALLDQLWVQATRAFDALYQEHKALSEEGDLASVEKAADVLGRIHALDLPRIAQVLEADLARLRMISSAEPATEK
jgi:hypothetical protein